MVAAARGRKHLLIDINASVNWLILTQDPE
jgi:hypothetical protein